MTKPLLAWSVAVLAAATAGGGSPEPRAALVEPPYRVERVEIEADSARVVLTLRRDMNTAGWDLRVEGVDPEDGGRRIRVRLLAVPPEGLAAQVITPREVRVDLGTPPAGRVVVELWEREAGGTDLRPVQAEVLAVAGTPASR